MNVIEVSKVFTKYDPDNHYRLWATGSSTVVLKLTNIAPMDVPIGNDLDCIDFLSTIPLFAIQCERI